MIIWSRWGILVVLFAALGAGIGAGIGTALGTPGLVAGVGLLVAAVGIWAFDRYVLLPHLDRPRPVYVNQPLPVPETAPDGSQVTVRTVPALNQQGQPIAVRPRSTLFFVPFGLWAWIVGVVGVVVLIFGIVAATK